MTGALKHEDIGHVVGCLIALQDSLIVGSATGGLNLDVHAGFVLVGFCEILQLGVNLDLDVEDADGLLRRI